VLSHDASLHLVLPRDFRPSRDKAVDRGERRLVNIEHFSTILLLAVFLLNSDRLRSSGRHEHCQEGGGIANASCNRHQCFRYGLVLFR
jgi:hypothetical protein